MSSLLGAKGDIARLLSLLGNPEPKKYYECTAYEIIDSIKAHVKTEEKYLLKSSVLSNDVTLEDNTLSVLSMDRLDDELCDCFFEDFKENFYYKPKSLFKTKIDTNQFYLWNNCLASFVLYGKDDSLLKTLLGSIKENYYVEEENLFKSNPYKTGNYNFTTATNALAYIMLRQNRDGLEKELIQTIKDKFFNKKMGLFTNDTMEDDSFSCVSNSLAVMALAMSKDPLATEVCQNMKKTMLFGKEKVFKARTDQDYIVSEANSLAIMALLSIKDNLASELIQNLKDKMPYGVSHHNDFLTGNGTNPTYGNLLALLVLTGYYFGSK